MAEVKFTPLADLGDHIGRSDDEMRARAAAFFDEIKRRHTVREFTDQPVPREVMENCIAAAGPLKLMTPAPGCCVQHAPLWHPELRVDPINSKFDTLLSGATE